MLTPDLTFTSEKAREALKQLSVEFTMIEFLTAYVEPFISDVGMDPATSQNVADAAEAAAVLREVGCIKVRAGVPATDTVGHPTTTSVWRKP